MTYLPRVSVIIPTYNHAQYIGRAINSILGQTFKDFEIIVVDDGSTDSTKDIVSSYPNPVKYLRQDNRGPSTARNAGITASRGEFVAFLDSDDYFMKRNLEIKMSFLESNPRADWIYSDWQYVDDEGSPVKKGSSKFKYSEKKLTGEIFEELLRSRNFISPCTVVIKRSVLEDVGHFDTLIPSQEEYDLWLRISLKYPAYYIDKVLVFVTLHPKSLSTDFTKWVNGNAVIVEKLKDLIPHDFRDREKLLDKMLADRHTFIGRHFLQKGQFNEAINEFWQSIKRLPFQKRIYWLMCFAIVRSIMRYFYPATVSKKAGG
jgi:glycosyltransferase involved in cell wall biosynthesis